MSNTDSDTPQAMTEGLVERLREMAFQARHATPGRHKDERTANEAADHIAKLEAENAKLREGLERVYYFCNDTLSGRTDGPDDREWQRGAVIHARNVAREFVNPELHRRIVARTILENTDTREMKDGE